MKKIIIGLFLIMVTAVFINEKEQLLIPDNAIRFRIIANSDSKEDQNLKLEIKSEVEKELYKLVGEARNIEEARNIISNNLKEVDNILKEYNVEYDISYGNNYFPTKTYKGIEYNAGNYESLVITVGKGLGENWWCVLFPPLCLLEADETDKDEVEYKFFLQEIIDKYL